MMLSISFAVFIKSWLTFRLNHRVNRIVFDNMHKKQKASTIIRLSMLSLRVGMTGFEPATSRPPDVYSNRTELHPELCECKSKPYF